MLQQAARLHSFPSALWLAQFASALWLITLMWNDFFLDEATNLKEREIILIEPAVSSLL